ncbi:hypothetical protein ASF49_06855 [Methylobacterium sp. Leaf104]|uniref:hypothetical protein n=1 Tax=Methylobacterium TaxID=407 RepID=UPI0006F30B54|nr:MULTISPECIES: hypothetical protein [Methylobacterium]KQP33604.1 hypothetical protein ASF49_06855 [Methylobacterium sp. Leaf104]MCI9879862.1 hypothetical protein [Methylobacterium goesingense]
MWLTRRHLLRVAAIGGLLPVGAGVRASPLPPLPAGRIALAGFDVVSYFLDGPEPGRPAYEVSWAGRTWRFARAANREAFRAAPAAYAPRLGGFDPVGVLAGRLVDTDPLVYARLPGPDGTERLYLFRNDAHRLRVIAEPRLGAEAEARWPSLHDQIDSDFPD